MASEAYWERRKAVLMFDEMEKAEAGADEIANIFARGSVWLSSQMDRIFEKYRDKFGLTEEEARDLMSQMRDPSDIDELMAMLRRRQDTMARQELLKKLEASAYRYRINRLKHLQDDIVRLMSQIARQQQGIVKDTLQTIGRDSFYHEIYDLQQRTGTAFPFNKVNTKLIDQVMRSKWSGENYSSRIWSNADELAKILKEELLLSMATGRSERDAARVISEKMQSGSMQARRLIRTESNYIYTEMDMRAYEEAGIEEYIFIAILDLRTSKICRKLDGQIFKVKDHKSGKNCPPMHPWCRSTTGGVISRELLKKMTRIARDPVTGKSIHVPMTMNYQEWYEKYVEGTGADKKKAEPGSRNLTQEQFERYRERGVGPESYEEFLKAKADPETWSRLKRDFKDTKEFEKYREVLGNDIPDTLEKFQDIKYNDEDTWSFVKLDFTRRRKLLNNPQLVLPGLDHLKIDDRKFTRYFFNIDNAGGWAKGEAFKSRLGYNEDNWEMLQAEIHKRAAFNPATYKRTSQYGDLYEQRIIIYGLKGTPANLEVGWIHTQDGMTAMTTAYITEVKNES